MVMSNAWSIWIIVIVALHIIAYAWLLFSTSKMKAKDHKKGETTGHEWDGIKEYNNPLPKWWLYMFVLTIIFAVVYLVLYPGMGNYKGTLDWTQEKEWAAENEVVKAKKAELFATFINKSIPEMIKPVINEDGSIDNTAMEIGERLFANHCSTCHGSDAGGAIGFPSLIDDDWLYGSKPENILQSIAQGRNGVMPPWGAALGDEGVTQVAAYIRNFTVPGQDQNEVAEGQKKYSMFCIACHGADAKGNQMLGGPNLTDDIWLHSYDDSRLESIIRDGIAAIMPKHKELLDDDSIKVLAAYVYSLQNEQ